MDGRGGAGQRAAVKEVRLALVCYGGVSLAIYMHGVTKEIHKLLLASHAFERDQQRNPFAPGQSQHVYWELLRRLYERDQVRTRVVVDIVSGTSAGGINGVYLAKAIAHNASQDALRALWFEQGDIGRLVRFWRRLPVKLRFALFGLEALRSPLGVRPPLRGDDMCRWLYDALAAMDGTSGGVAGDTLVPADQSVELFVTMTDLVGYRRYIPISDRVVSDRTHRHVMRFCFDHTHDQLDRDHNGALAFAARATSCFPGAFPPLGVADFQAALGPGRRFDADRLEQEFFPAYALWDERARDTYFIDGGVLDNFPFGHAIDAIVRKRAGTEVARWLVYIEPDPAEPPPPSRGRDLRAARPPGWLATIWSGISGIPKREPILDDLVRLRDVNERIQYVADLTRAGFDDVHDQLRQLAGTLLQGEPVSPAQVAEQMTAVHAKARERVGGGYASYVQLKLDAVSRRLAGLVAEAFAYPPESSQASFVRAVMLTWVQRYRIRPEDRSLKRQTDFLDTFDLPYRERRLRYVIQGVSELYRDWPAQRAKLDTAKTALYDFLDRLADASDPGKVRSAVGELPFGVFGKDQLKQWVSSDRLPDEFLREHGQAVGELVDRVGQVLTERLRGFSADLWRRFAELTGAWDAAMRVTVMVRYVGFPLWDTQIFPVLELSDVGQLNRIAVKRISPDDGKRLPPPPGGKLQGVALHHFGAFFRRSAREHDYLWGRLDGVEQLIGLLDRDAPASAYRRGFEAVFDEEQALGEAGKLRAQLAAALGALDGPPAGGPAGGTGGPAGETGGPAGGNDGRAGPTGGSAGP